MHQTFCVETPVLEQNAVAILVCKGISHMWNNTEGLQVQLHKFTKRMTESKKLNTQIIFHSRKDP